MSSKIKIIGSGSSGNCIAIYNSIGEFILLDVGLRYETIMKSIGYDLSKIAFVLATHCHLDHVRSLDKFIKLGIPCYANEDVCEKHKGCNPLPKLIDMQGFRVQNFALKHNVPNNAFIVDSDGIRYLYVTDTTFVPKVVKNVNYAIIEANYDDDYIIDNAVNDSFSQSMHYNHQSLERCGEYLKMIHSASLNGVILHHLSNSNICESDAVDYIRKELGMKNVCAAVADMEITTSEKEF